MFKPLSLSLSLSLSQEKVYESRNSSENAFKEFFDDL